MSWEGRFKLNECNSHKLKSQYSTEQLAYWLTHGQEDRDTLHTQECKNRTASVKDVHGKR